MRIDHAQAHALPPHHTPQYATHHGDSPGAGKHVIAKDAFRLLQAEVEDSADSNLDQCPTHVGLNADGFERKGQAWFVASELQSDLVVQVGDMSFHLHKFPLLSRSGKLNRLVFDSRDTENSHIELDDMPGGPETFELAAKFCYGIAVELTSANVANLRCAAEYLEMTEDLEEGNLVSKTEEFLTFVVLASWKDSVAVLQSCEKLIPLAEQLKIVRRCCESIAWKACTDPRGIRWSFTERRESKKVSHASPRWAGPKTLANTVSDQVPSDWWIEDICVVCVSFFTKIIHALQVKGMRYDLIGSAIVHYAMKWSPRLTREFMDYEGPQSLVQGSFLTAGEYSPHPAAVKNKDDRTSDASVSEDKIRELVEALAGILPTQKDGVPCTFLLRLIRLAKMVSADPELVTGLEKRAGVLLDQGTLSDLLIPSFDPTSETLFDVDLVQRLLDYFLLQDSTSSPGRHSPADADKDKSAISPTLDNVQTPHSTNAAKMRVAKLIDNYLAEVGGDQNLTINKFLALAEALPEHTRPTDDGLYKALDTYLKAHPTLSEHDRKKLCRTLDCQRLSLDACMHAAQNERLPLRVVVQVLFGEQVKLRSAGTATSTGSADISREHSGPCQVEDDRLGMIVSESRSSSQTCVSPGHEPENPEEIEHLRSDVERMKGKFMALQHDYSAIQQELEKLRKYSKPRPSGWKKLPHFLTHPLDIFHHHHHDKDHPRKDNHKEHDKHLEIYHDRHSKEQHSHHHAKKQEIYHRHQLRVQESHHSPHSHHTKDRHLHHAHHGHHQKDYDSHHGHLSKDHDSHHSGHGHRHHSKDGDYHNSGNGRHAKDYESHHGHHPRSREHHTTVQDSHHEHHSREHDSHHEHLSKDHRDSHHGHHSNDHHGSHPGQYSKDQDGSHNGHHSKEHLGSHKGHQPRSHRDSHHGHHSKDHHVSQDTHRSHHGQHSKERLDYNQHLHTRDSHHSSHSKPSDHLPSQSDHSVDNDHQHLKDHKHLPPHSNHAKEHDHHHPKDQKPGHIIDDDECHPSSSIDGHAEDSSRSLDGPATPTHFGEHDKKHPRPFANAIRRWRNSIS